MAIFKTNKDKVSNNESGFLTRPVGRKIGAAAVALGLGAGIAHFGSLDTKDPLSKGSGVTELSPIYGTDQDALKDGISEITGSLAEQPDQATVTLTIPEGGTISEAVDEFRDTQAGVDVDATGEAGALAAEYGDPRSIQPDEKITIPVQPPASQSVVEPASHREG